MTGPGRAPARRLTALVAASLAVLSGCAAGPPPDDGALPGCTGVLFVGVRGSGESATREHALGTTVGDLYARLAGNHPHLAVTAYGLPYAAQTTGTATVLDAAARLSALVLQRRRGCPGERLVLAGFSLGAEVLGDALQAQGPARPDPPLAAAVLLADPRFDPADAATAAGTFDPRYRGDRPRPPFPAGTASRIRSYCRDHDAICQTGDPAVDKSQHGRYSPQQTCQALAFIEQSLGIGATPPGTCTAQRVRTG
jgi:Cutinase